MQSKAQRYTILAIVVSLLILLCTVVVLWDGDQQIAFDSNAWKEDLHTRTGFRLRRRMMQDLLTRVLPGTSRAEIESELGYCPTREEAELVASNERSGKLWKEIQRKRRSAGRDYHNDFFTDLLEFDWDMTYHLGRKQRENTLQLLLVSEQDPEFLLIRLDKDGRFESWYTIDFGQTPWKEIVGPSGNATYRDNR